MLLLCGIVAALAALLILALTRVPPEPSYQGKPLTYWVQQLADTNSPTGLVPQAAFEPVRQALLHMGTNATLMLADWACYDRPLRRHLLQKLPRALRRSQYLSPQLIDDPHGLRGGYAGQALIILGPHASPAFPKLGRTLTDGEFWGVADRDLWVLRTIGQPAVPTLAAAMTNKPSRMRDIIAINLGTMGPQAAAAVPALKSMLADTNPVLRNIFIRSIEQITGQPFTNAPAN